MEIGIVGLPNVGKSTIFNALTSGKAAASNYPFTTIDPNVGVAAVPDARLKRLTDLFKPKKTVPAAVRFVDIAGLVKGASEGAGLGNQFLAHIREVDAVLHMVRLFRDPDVVHTLGSVDPRRDAEIIETELLLADLSSVEKQFDKVSGKARSGDKASQALLTVLEALRKGLGEGKTARSLGLDEKLLAGLGLLTLKPMLFAGNIDEKPDEAPVATLKALAAERGAGHVTLCGKIEAEIAELDAAERAEFLASLGMECSGLERVAAAAYSLLGLESFFTVGPDEVRAWTIRRGTKAPQGAGVIHTDFEKGFIRAEIYSYADIDKHEKESVLREKGLIRSEGRDYVMKDGDVCFFKFSP